MNRCPGRAGLELSGPRPPVPIGSEEIALTVELDDSRDRVPCGVPVLTAMSVAHEDIAVLGGGAWPWLSTSRFFIKVNAVMLIVWFCSRPWAMTATRAGPASPNPESETLRSPSASLIRFGRSRAEITSTSNTRMSVCAGTLSRMAVAAALRASTRVIQHFLYLFDRVLYVEVPQFGWLTLIVYTA